jgi:hypothetical protein
MGGGRSPGARAAGAGNLVKSSIAKTDATGVAGAAFSGEG